MAIPKPPPCRATGLRLRTSARAKEVYLDGAWAELFQRQIRALANRIPSEEEVEATLERYASLAQNPVLIPDL